MDTKNHQIEEILYLASLTSNMQAVDPMLDTLRLITSRQSSDKVSQLSVEDMDSLASLKTRLVTYLTTEDPVRKFTKESLERRIHDHFTAHSPQIRRKKRVLSEVFGILGISFIAYGLAFGFLHGTNAVRSTLAAPAFMLSINIGLAWLFWSARKELVSELQKAYSYLAAGIILSAIISIQYPIFSAYPNLTHHLIFENGGFMLAYPFMYFLLFWAFYLIARQLPTITLRLLKLRNILIVGAVLALIVVIIPHHSPVSNELLFRLSFLSVSSGVYLSILGGILAFIAARHMSTRFSKPIMLLGVAQVVFFVTSLAIATLLYLEGHVSPLDTKITAISTIFVISLLSQLAAGYLFKRGLQE